MPANMEVHLYFRNKTANYLQKYIVARKRKIFVGERTAADLEPMIVKKKKKKFLFLVQIFAIIRFLISWKSKMS
jgi:uroporphyrinogen-III synthase